MERTSQGTDLNFLMVKNETRHPVEKPEVVSKQVSNAAIFPTIFNHLDNQ